MSSDDLADMEKRLLQLLEYRVSLKASLYTKYYFEMKNISSSSPNTNKSALKPLDRREAEIIEARTAQTQKIVQEWKSKSVESVGCKSRMVLN